MFSLEDNFMSKLFASFDMIREWIVQTVYFVCVGANCKMSQKGVKLGQASQNKFNVACWGWGVEATINSIVSLICFVSLILRI